jgi:hypothetical protein
MNSKTLLNFGIRVKGAATATNEDAAIFDGP